MKFKGQEVFVRVGGSSDDVEVLEAYYEESGVDLTDEEVEELREEYADELYREYMEYSIDRADSLFDAMMDK